MHVITVEKPLKRTRLTAPQPIAAATNPDALLNIKTVSAITGLSAPSLYRIAKRGELVPIRMGTRCTRFRAGDVTDWLRSKVAP